MAEQYQSASDSTNGQRHHATTSGQRGLWRAEGYVFTRSIIQTPPKPKMRLGKPGSNKRRDAIDSSRHTPYRQRRRAYSACGSIIQMPSTRKMKWGAIESGTRERGSDPRWKRESSVSALSLSREGSDPLSRVPLSIAPDEMGNQPYMVFFMV